MEEEKLVDDDLELELDFSRSDSESSESSGQSSDDELDMILPGEIIDEDNASDDLAGGDGAGAGVVCGQVMFGLYEPIADENRENNTGDAEIPELNDDRLQIFNWCDCGHCEVLPSFTPGDCVCCREIPEVQTETDKYGSACITTTEPFAPAILHPISLYIGWMEFTDRWRQAAKSFDERSNEKYRYVAYRKLVRWCWGWLGKDIRVQLPACAHARIMKEYPDGQNRYKGTVLHPLVVD